MGQKRQKHLIGLLIFFDVSPFMITRLVIFMIITKTNPLYRLFTGIIWGGIFTLIFQPEIVAKVGRAKI